jgi:hypothetical protein
MAYAVVSDVEVLLAREMSPEEQIAAQRRLEQVERMIKRRVPDLDVRALDDEYRATLVDVESESVSRVLRNPDGIVQESEGSYSYMKSQQAADNSLRLTNDEWTALGVRVGGMFTIVANPVMPR